MRMKCGDCCCRPHRLHHHATMPSQVAPNRQCSIATKVYFMLRRLFSLIIFLAVVTGCFWFYRTLTLASPYDEAWTAINSRLPDPLPDPIRSWSCQTVRRRLVDPGPAPLGCEKPGDW